MNRRRKPAESYKDYRHNQYIENLILKRKLKGNLIVDIDSGKPFRRSLKKDIRIWQKEKVMGIPTAKLVGEK